MIRAAEHLSERFSGRRIFYYSSILFAFILAFIDEGNFSFDWMRNAGDWIAMLVYAMCIFLGQYLAHRYVFNHSNERWALALSVLLGTIVGICIPIAVFSSFAITLS